MGDELDSLLDLRARAPARLRARRLLPRAVDQAAGQGGRLRRGLGRRPPRPSARPPAKRDLELVLDEGGGAFYGPKISVQARDAIGRTWQMSTIQLDFQEPARFGLEYVGADNERHPPIMIHRALFGSIERFFGVLVEHYAGAFPAWLAPEQVRVLPVRERPPGLRPSRRRPAPVRRLPRRRWPRPTSRWAAASARPSWRSSPTCSWSATTTSRPAPSASTARGADQPERDVHVDAFAEALAAEVRGQGLMPPRSPLGDLAVRLRHGHRRQPRRSRATERRRRAIAVRAHPRRRRRGGRRGRRGGVAGRPHASRS